MNIQSCHLGVENSSWIIAVSITETIFELRHDKTNKVSVRPAKTQISLGIRVFAVRLNEPWVLSYPLSRQRRLWSHWADAQADLSLRWAHMPLCWFCHEAAHLTYYRDVLILGVVDALTCLLAGFAIFSILGYLAYNQEKDVEEVIKEGKWCPFWTEFMCWFIELTYLINRPLPTGLGEISGLLPFGELEKGLML